VQTQVHLFRVLVVQVRHHQLRVLLLPVQAVAVVVPIVALLERVVAVVEVLVLFKGMVRQVQQILVAEAVVVLAHIQEMVVLVVRVL
jgi:hypothetical protein